MASTVPDKLHIGVLIPEEVQLLDLAAVDLFSMLSSDYLKRCHLPEAIYQIGIPEVKIFYIADMTAGAQQDTTAGAKIRITHSLDDEEVQPGKLDIILVPGPFPPPTTTEKFKQFVQAHFEHGNQSSSTVTTGNAPKKTEFLVVCTGSFVAGNCGILDGKNATGPRFALEDLNSLFPKAKWDGSRRWVRDGNVWTCGTILNGLDMVSAFLKEMYPRTLVQLVLYSAQVADRPLKYEETIEQEISHFLF